MVGVSGDASGGSSSATPYDSAREAAGVTRGGDGRGGDGRSGDGGSCRGDAGGLAKPPPPLTAPASGVTTPTHGDGGGVGGDVDAGRRCGGTNALTRGDCGEPGGTVTVSLAPPGAVPVAAAPR
jgi:hypothetical protein